MKFIASKHNDNTNFFVFDESEYEKEERFNYNV